MTYDPNFGADPVHLHRVVADYRKAYEGYLRAAELLKAEADRIEANGFTYPPLGDAVSMSIAHASPAAYLRAAGDPYWRSARGAMDIDDDPVVQQMRAEREAHEEAMDAAWNAEVPADDPCYDFCDFGFGEPLNSLDEDTRTAIARLLERVCVSIRDGFLWDTPHSNYSCSIDPADVRRHAFVFTNEKYTADHWAGEPPVVIQVAPEDILNAVKLALSYEDMRTHDDDLYDAMVGSDTPFEPPYMLEFIERDLKEKLLTQLGAWQDALKEAYFHVFETKIAAPEKDE